MKSHIRDRKRSICSISIICDNKNNHLNSPECNKSHRLRLILLVNIVLLVIEIQTIQVLLWPMNHMCARSNTSLNNYTTLYNSHDRKNIDLDVIQTYLLDGSAEDMFTVAKASSLGVEFDDVAHCTEYPIIYNNADSTKNITINMEGLETCRYGLHFDELDPVLSVVGHFKLACQRQWIKILFPQLIVLGFTLANLLTWLLVRENSTLLTWIMWNTTANSIGLICAVLLRFSMAVDSGVNLSSAIELIILFSIITIRIMSHISIVLRCSELYQTTQVLSRGRFPDETKTNDDWPCKSCSRCICQRGYLFSNVIMVVVLVAIIGKAAYMPFVIHMFNHWTILNSLLSLVSLINWLVNSRLLHESSTGSLKVENLTIEAYCSKDTSRDFDRANFLNGEVKFIDFGDNINTIHSSTVKSRSCDDSEQARGKTDRLSSIDDRVKLINLDKTVPNTGGKNNDPNDMQSQDVGHNLLLQIDTHDSRLESDNNIDDTDEETSATKTLSSDCDVFFSSSSSNGLRQDDCLNKPQTNILKIIDSNGSSSIRKEEQSDPIRSRDDKINHQSNELLSQNLKESSEIELARYELRDDKDIYEPTTISRKLMDHHCCGYNRPNNRMLVDNETSNQIDRMPQVDNDCDDFRQEQQQQLNDQRQLNVDCKDLTRFRLKSKLWLLMFCLALNYFLFQAIPNHKLLHIESMESLNNRKLNYRLEKQRSDLSESKDYMRRGFRASNQYNIRRNEPSNRSMDGSETFEIVPLASTESMTTTTQPHRQVINNNETLNGGSDQRRLDPHYEASDPMSSSVAINSSSDASFTKLNNDDNSNNNNNIDLDHNKDYNKAHDSSEMQSTPFDYRSSDYARNVYRSMRDSYNPLVILDATIGLFGWHIELTVLLLHIEKLTRFDSIFFNPDRLFRIQKYGSIFLTVEWLVFGLFERVHRQNHLLENTWLRIFAISIAKLIVASMFYGYLYILLRLRRKTGLKLLLDLRPTLTIITAALGIASLAPTLVSIPKQNKEMTRQRMLLLIPSSSLLQDKANPLAVPFVLAMNNLAAYNIVAKMSRSFRKRLDQRLFIRS